MNIIGIIPARYNSSRFPGKPLVKINGISMIERVYNQATKTKFLKKVIVATDDERISTHVTNFGGIAIMTSTNVKNGTERCYIALKILQELSPNLNYDVIINIQGDEPFIQPSEIDTLAKCFIDDNNTQIATLIKEISNEKDLFNPSIIKVITDINNFAIYFSRSPIPFIRDTHKNEWLKQYKFMKHIGIYAFKKEILENVTKLTPSSLEKAESLEQLRWIENGYKIKTNIAKHESFSIDTPEDLKKVEKIFSKKN